MDTLEPGNFKNFSLLGKTLSYDIDVSTVGCSCNAALYFVSMPGFTQSGQADPTSGRDYYCDANEVGGEYCWELDTYEGNKYTVQTTPHKCDSAAGQHIWNCDRGGCGQNAWYADNKGMCPDGSCKINTSQPYNHAVTYVSTNGQLSRVHNQFTQNGKTFQFDACNDGGYLSQMS
jgi:cellulase